ncbi:MAG: ATP-binding protein [Myxococcaceae bacterium]|nr:ATP-binding protein [Myxococcaceae bacterium]
MTDDLHPTPFRALTLPANALALELTQAVRAQRPGSFVAYTEHSSFDPLEFHQAGQCSLTPLPGSPVLEHWTLTERRDDVWRYGRQGWYELQWAGVRFEVVVATFGACGGCPESSWWIVAPDEGAAKRLFLATTRFCDDVHGQVLVFSNGRFQKSAELHQAIKQARWSDLVLPGNLAEDIRADARRFFERKDFYERHRLPWKRGVLLIGPPGNGKSHTIRALLSELGRPTIVVRGFEGRDESPAGGIKKVFERARHNAPSVIVFEDLDCLVDERTRSLLLNELDGFALNTGLFIIATTNHPEKIDRSLLDRPSRFDRKFHFPLPDAPTRRAFLTQLDSVAAEGLHLSPEGLATLVERTHGFTFAYLKELHLSAALCWADQDGRRSFEALLAETAELLARDLKTVAQTIGPLPSNRSIGFGEASA